MTDQTLRCRELWQSVLMGGIQDTQTKTATLNKNYQTNQRMAWAWLDTQDFRTVCDLAGMNPGFIRDAVKSGKLNGKALMRAEVETVG